MPDFKIELIIDYLKNNHIKDATEISDCLELLNIGLESALESVNTDMQSHMKAKNYVKLRELTDFSEEISKIQVIVESYASLFDVEPDEDNIIDEDISEEQKSIPNYTEYTVDTALPHSLYENFTNKKVTAFSLSGVRYEVKDWKDVLMKTCNLLASENSDVFYAFVNDPAMKGRKNSYFGLTPVAKKNAKMDELNLYVWTNLSANHIRNLIRKLLKKFNMKIENYFVYLRADYTPLHTGDNNTSNNVSDEEDKIGKFVRLFMRDLSDKQHVFSQKELMDMQSKEWSKEVLGINYPFIKQYTEGKDISLQIKEGGYLRYWKETFEYGGKKFLITSRWFDRDREKIEKWLKNIKERV